MLASWLLAVALAFASPDEAPPPPTLTPHLVLMTRQTFPVGEKDADGKRPRPSAEIYNARVRLEGAWRVARAVLEVRLRQTPLRTFSPSNVWLQQAYVDVATSEGLHWQAGLLYERIGVEWDDSWFGNVGYLDGLKLNPDLGVSNAGDLPVAPTVRLRWEAQYFLQEDGLNGFYAPEAKRVALGDTPGVVGWDGYTLDPDSSPLHSERSAVVLHLHPAFGRELTISPDFAFRQSDILYEVSRGATVEHRVGHRTIASGGVVLEHEGLRLLGEGIWERVTGLGDPRWSVHWMTGARYTWTRPGDPI